MSLDPTQITYNATPYHGLHEYSTFSSSIIRTTQYADEDDEEWMEVPLWRKLCCFLCRLNQTIILHPVGPFRCVWDLLVMILLIYTSIEIPYTFSFGQSTMTVYIGLFVDALLFIDIFLNFHTAYFDKYDNLRLVTNKRYICKKYFRTWFLIDFLTCIPFGLIFDHTVNTDGDSEVTSDALNYIKILRVFRLLRIIKILRFLKMLRIFDAFMKQFIVREVIVAMKVFRIIFGMLLFSHFAACLWWYVGSTTAPSWIDGEGLRDDDATAIVRYSTSWYWAVVTLFTTGYGDITATNTLEQWVCSICILIGTCFFAYFVGTLTVLITEGDRIKSYELEKLEEAQSFCEKKKLPRELSRAILTHIRYHCNYNYVFDETEILNLLPAYLKHDISTFVAKQFLASLPIFASLPDHIIGLIAVKTKSISCNQHYKLYEVGDMAKEMYIQRTGKATMYNKNNEKICDMTRGSVCGEYSSILFKKRKKKVECDTWSEFYSVSIDDIREILQLYFPKSSNRKWKKIKDYLRVAYKKGRQHAVPLTGTDEISHFDKLPSLHSSASGADTNGHSAGFPTVYSPANSLHVPRPAHRPNENSVHLFNNTKDPKHAHHHHTSNNLHAFVYPTRDRGGSQLSHLSHIRPTVASPIPPPESDNDDHEHDHERDHGGEDVHERKQKQSTKSIKPLPADTQVIHLKDTSRDLPRTSHTVTASNMFSLSTLRNSKMSPVSVDKYGNPRLKKFAKFQIRSNSELRNWVVVQHAEKHNKLATPKTNRMPGTPQFGMAKSTANLFSAATSNPYSASNPQLMKRYRSEPAIKPSAKSLDFDTDLVIKSSITEMTAMQKLEAQEKKKRASMANSKPHRDSGPSLIRSNLSYRSLSIPDSECSFFSSESGDEDHVVKNTRRRKGKVSQKKKKGGKFGGKTGARNVAGKKAQLQKLQSTERRTGRDEEFFGYGDENEEDNDDEEEEEVSPQPPPPKRQSSPNIDDDLMSALSSKSKMKSKSPMATPRRGSDSEKTPTPASATGIKGYTQSININIHKISINGAESEAEAEHDGQITPMLMPIIASNREYTPKENEYSEYEEQEDEENIDESDSELDAMVAAMKDMPTEPSPELLPE